MKTLIFIAIIMLCAFASAEAQTIAPAPPDKAVVYFVRLSSLGFAINFSYFDSTQLIAKFAGPGYVRYVCDTGRHLFWARSENKSFVEADVEAGKIYFIEAMVRMGAIKAGVELDPVDPNNAKRMNKIFKMITRDNPASSTPEELKIEEQKMQDVITRGIEKYKADKQKGKEISELTKTMYYEK
jgi:hypothetical protein